MSPLAPPSAQLLACVVVPARDEESRVAACLTSLADQHGLDAAAYEVILVLDGCRDATEQRALQAAAAHPGLALRLRRVSTHSAGAARRVGMDLACARLLALDRPEGLIASTDADTVVASDWLERQLAAMALGAGAVGGRIELSGDEQAALAPEVLADRGASLRRRRARARAGAPAATRTLRVDHGQFSGASMGVAAGPYAELGGLEPSRALEDEALERALVDRGVAIARPADVRVTTSARTGGRAPRGLAADLSVGHWHARRSYRADDYSLGALLSAKQERVCVILPAREVAGTIATILQRLDGPRARGLIDELVVVDADSSDGTAELARAAGARVVSESEPRADHGPCRGKGDALWRALSVTGGEVVAFLDADTADFDVRFLLGLLGPLLSHPELRLVKGAFRRPLRVGAGVVPDGGGRVTELLARPTINLLFPLLAGFHQPLAGELAARRDLLEQLPFPVGYGVELAMLVDAERLVGLDALAQVDLGTRQNRHQPLLALGAMAYAILVAAERRRPSDAGGVQTPPTTLTLASAAGLDPREVAVEERPPLASLRAPVLATRPGPRPTLSPWRSPRPVG